ncbi:DUF938 domain-containing protein [Ruegeria lacuscaerulensis]|uniref:DUF938 domain-containing protein n=1 Tax=Ruegeria lacuscaerulensis TaxID=55218 RepID=UPI001479948B|nr:DUF938 domain-containing protein [Ruegeria lacuscaerulensis]
MSKRTLPPNASVATQVEGARMVAPAATRNADVLCDLLAQWAPDSGNALEIASGTGQHVSAFAQRLPGLTWHPTEIDPDRRASINTYTVEQVNIKVAATLDATAEGWHREFGGKDLIVLINLTHLISWVETCTILTEVSKALEPKGRFILYGPFMRAGKLTSDGDQRFHQALVQQDPEIGYKNDSEIAAYMQARGLTILKISEMPANNIAFIAENSGT